MKAVHSTMFLTCLAFGLFWLNVKCNCEAKDCRALYQSGATKDGVYTIDVGDHRSLKVFCDMTSDSGSWLVIQRRHDGTEDFYRPWSDYKEGFGTLTSEFWLGLKYIHEITTADDFEIRFDLWDNNGIHKYAKYSHFRVGPESDFYRLHVQPGSYSGTAGDAWTDGRQNGARFSTKDSDNDAYKGHCSQLYHGAWWYDSCHVSNLNGEYGNNAYGTGLNWRPWKGYYYSLKKTEMKIRPMLSIK